MTAPGAAQSLHPDRLLPAEPGDRAIARRLYDAVRDLPVISPHGHVDPRLLLANEPFPDPATLFVTPDHYVTRLLHADGVGLDALGVGQGPLSEAASRAAWRLLCERWDLFRGTPVRFWLEAELTGPAQQVWSVAFGPRGPPWPRPTTTAPSGCGTPRPAPPPQACAPPAASPSPRPSGPTTSPGAFTRRPVVREHCG